METIKLVVVMSAVDLWKAREALLRARVTTSNDRWLFVIFVENQRRSARAGGEAIILSTYLNKLSAA